MIRRQIIRKKMKKCYENWPVDLNSAEKPENWEGWPNGKNFALVLTHDVELQKGHDVSERIAEVEEKYGLRASFNFVPFRYDVSSKLRQKLTEKNFEIGVHGLYHDGWLFNDYKTFSKRADIINEFIKAWDAKGFRAPAMHRNLEWIRDLDIEYDASTFDTDPFEPMPEGMGTIFPFWVLGEDEERDYVELPYTMAQDSTLFILMENEGVDIWKKKADWVAENGGMILMNTHPDYMCFEEKKCYCYEEYPIGYYEEILKYITEKYEGQYWNAIPSEMADFWKKYKNTKKDFHLRGVK